VNEDISLAAPATGLASAPSPAGAADAAGSRPPSGVRRRFTAIALAAIVPACLLLFWDLMVRWTGTRLIPLRPTSPS